MCSMVPLYLGNVSLSTASYYSALVRPPRSADQSFVNEFHNSVCADKTHTLLKLHTLHINPSSLPPLTQSNGMMNNSSSLPSIYSHQKLEPLLYCNNHCRCLRWAPPLLYIFQSGAGRACSLITPTDKMQRDLWPWPRRLIASASAVPLSGNEAHSRNPIRSTQCALKFSS